MAAVDLQHMSYRLKYHKMTDFFYIYIIGFAALYGTTFFQSLKQQLCKMPVGILKLPVGR